MNASPFLLRSMFKKLSFFIGILAILGSRGMAGGIQIRNFGHSSLLIKGGGHSVLLNPFKAVGCAKGLSEPKAQVDIVLASSELLDEGYWQGKGIVFVKPGSYSIRGLSLEGFSTAHDRLGGRRFGTGTFWQWTQGGVNFAHLGGIAGPIDAQRFLLGRPDVLFIGVGGGAKVYNAEEAKAIIVDLNPKIVIPVQYVRGQVPENCDQSGIEPFLNEIKDWKTKRVGNTYKLPKKLPEQTTVNLMH